MKTRGRRFGAVVLALTALGAAGGPTTVNAECGRLDRWPSFSSGAASASSIVVGKVTRIVERNREYPSVRFQFHVTERILGRAPGHMVVHANTDEGCIVSVLTVRVGDVLAIASGNPESADGIEGPITAVAFVNRRPPHSLMPGMQRLGIAEIRSFGELPDTSTARTWDSTGVVGRVGHWAAMIPVLIFATTAAVLQSLFLGLPLR